MYLLPLVAGFLLNWASAFTTTYSRWWGEARGRLACLVLRDVIAIPLWVLGLSLAVRRPAPRLFGTQAPVENLGWLLFAAGLVPIVLALPMLGRRAAAPSVRDNLARRGIYARVRHPIHAGMLLVFAGLALAQPTGPVVLACALGVLWVIVQTRLEEADLLQRLPTYRAYMAQVPRFVPRVGGR